MATDLDQRIRRLIDAAPPLTIEEISNPKRRSRRDPRAVPFVVASLTIAVLAAALAIAVTSIGASHNGRSISVANPPATTAPSGTDYGPPLPGCKWTGDAWDPSAPASIKAQGPPQGFWQCPATIAQAQKILGIDLPTPQIPANWSIAYQTVSGMGSTWLFNRTWTPDGQPPQNRPGEQFLQLRIRKHPPQAASMPDNTTLANGDRADAGLSYEASSVEWTHEGVDFALGAVGVNTAHVLNAANSLP